MVTALLLYCQKQALIEAEDLWPLACTLSDRECVPAKWLRAQQQPELALHLLL